MNSVSSKSCHFRLSSRRMVIDNRVVAWKSWYNNERSFGLSRLGALRTPVESPEEEFDFCSIVCRLIVICAPDSTSFVSLASLIFQPTLEWNDFLAPIEYKIFILIFFWLSDAIWWTSQVKTAEFFNESSPVIEERRWCEEKGTASTPGALFCRIQAAEMGKRLSSCSHTILTWVFRVLSAAVCFILGNIHCA